MGTYCTQGTVEGERRQTGAKRQGEGWERSTHKLPACPDQDSVPKELYPMWSVSDEGQQSSTERAKAAHLHLSSTDGSLSLDGRAHGFDCR